MERTVPPAPAAGIYWDALVYNTQGHILPTESQGMWDLREPDPRS